MNIFVTGGATSGKSAFAEQSLLDIAGDTEKIYIACMKNDSPAAGKRIVRHRALREGKGFVTIEKPAAVGELADRVKGTSILIEGAGMLLSNELFRGWDFAYGNRNEAALSRWQRQTEDVCKNIIHDILSLMEVAANAVIVSDEVFSDGRTYDRLTESYIACLGQINCALVKKCDRAVEVVYSYPVDLPVKGGNI